MYSDIEHKLKYHKERIMQSFIKQGVYPDNRLIQSRLNSIELRLSIFKSPKIKEGSTFNTNEFNNAIKCIYDDLAILYKLLYEVTVVEYNKLSYYIDSHLRELDEVSRMYLKRAELESYSTAMGKSLYFSHNNFNVDKSGDTSVVNLGKIEIENASKVACILNSNNVDYSNAVFKFKNGDDIVSCNAYNYNHDTVIFPGENIRHEYNIKISDSQKINGKLELPILAENISGGSFITLAGKDKILYKKANKNKEIIEEKPVAINALSFSSHSYIDFYVIGGTSINFRFSKKPVATNFNMNSNRIENLNYIHHFFIECDEDFSFDFELEKGSVYAVKENTLVDQNKLYYSGQIDVKDFMIIHTVPGEKKTYDTTIEIHNTSVSEDDIDSIMIKKVG